MKRKLLKVFLNVAIVASIMVMLNAAAEALTTKYNNYLKTSEIEEVSKLLEESIQENNHSLDYYRNYYNNNNIVGSLKIEGTDIDTLLVQGDDNKYYLNHSIKNEYDELGSVFVDYRTDLSSNQVNIYGHNSNVYDVIFKELENYLKEDYYDEHKYIEVWNGDVTNIYEIFSVQIVTSDYEHYVVNPTDKKEHLRKLSNSIYQTEVITNESDDILVIQTCLFNPSNSFLIINSRKVREV